MSTPQEYRAFAEQCVSIAENSSSPEMRKTLLQMAETWLRLAESTLATEIAGYRQNNLPSQQIAE
jgi:hypothetical protein